VLIDVTNSWAVLIGTASYTPNSGLEDLPAVRNNLTDLAAALTHPDILGLPEDQIVTLLDPTEAGVVGEAILTAGERSSGTLLIYYAGHGLPDEDGHLFLALPGTRSQDLPYHALPFQWLAKGIRRSIAATRVLILDCCYAGLSERPTMSGKDLVGEQATITGTWTLFSSAYDTPSLAPAGAAHTAFTGALIDVLNTGIPDGPEELDGEAVLEELRRRLVPMGFPRPDQRNTDIGYRIAIGRNRARGRKVAYVKVKSHFDSKVTFKVGPTETRTATGEEAGALFKEIENLPTSVSWSSATVQKTPFSVTGADEVHVEIEPPTYSSSSNVNTEAIDSGSAEDSDTAE